MHSGKTNLSFNRRSRRRYRRRLFLLALAIILIAAVLVASIFWIFSGRKDADTKESKYKLIDYMTYQMKVEKLKPHDTRYPMVLTEEDVDKHIKEFKGKFGIKDYIYRHKDKIDIAIVRGALNNEEILPYLKAKMLGGEFFYSLNDKNKGEESYALKRKYPLYLQWDPRWAFNPYGVENEDGVLDGDVAVSGCGPSTMAMILSGLKSDKTITPDVLAHFAMKNDEVSEAGTKWSFFENVARKYGVDTYGIYPAKEEIDRAIKNGDPILAVFTPGRFTAVGHIMAIVGKDKSGKYIINAPNSIANSKKHWKWEELEETMLAAWGFEADR